MVEIISKQVSFALQIGPPMVANVLGLQIASKHRLIRMTYLCWNDGDIIVRNDKGNVKLFMLVLRMAITG